MGEVPSQVTDRLARRVCKDFTTHVWHRSAYCSLKLHSPVQVEPSSRPGGSYLLLFLLSSCPSHLVSLLELAASERDWVLNQQETTTLNFVCVHFLCAWWRKKSRNLWNSRDESPSCGFRAPVFGLNLDCVQYAWGQTWSQLKTQWPWTRSRDDDMYSITIWLQTWAICCMAQPWPPVVTQIAMQSMNLPSSSCMYCAAHDCYDNVATTIMMLVLLICARALRNWTDCKPNTCTGALLNKA